MLDCDLLLELGQWAWPCYPNITAIVIIIITIIVLIIIATFIFIVAYIVVT